MFELSVAFKYLVPRKKSLSTALISLMSVLVISLVVWLVVVFLSVTTGIEKNWLKKLTTLHAPIRICPTDLYYKSYYYQVDALAAASQYTLKTIGEKAESLNADPYSAEVDAELPASLAGPERVDLVKTVFHELDALGLPFQDYEIGGALLKIHRGSGSVVSQMSYLLSYPENNPSFPSLIVEQKQVRGDNVPVLLPKNYKESGIRVGDVGTLSYAAIGSLSAQEQKIAIQVSGFYDPGLVSIGNKCIIVPKEVTRLIHASTQTFSPDGTPTNGIFVWFDDLDSAPKIKADIEKRLQAAGVGKYWKVDTYRGFEFSKDLMLQFQSDRTLFLLIAAILLIVACCNIISLLVLLVNDKKKEIAILQSMGASFKSIAAIFGLCGASLGAISCLLGSALALFTLHNLKGLVSFLSMLQGHQAFNPAFFGNTLPNALSHEALVFVLIATPILSLAAGLIPAIKASRIRPSSVLRSE
ncbi:MAG: FtsX-like permease family protein [Verrucomicrobia bacterium]|nr:FtsX-like permease family protein [Verrucomicrobiota bacterium]MBU6445775.1 FtsX-like permease family protein [Verrucomicrobiota bacterium]MDE3046812.1 FtsX-like permease family protein [Verrucomicrobiota bacterium]